MRACAALLLCAAVTASAAARLGLPVRRDRRFYTSLNGTLTSPHALAPDADHVPPSLSFESLAPAPSSPPAPEGVFAVEPSSHGLLKDDSLSALSVTSFPAPTSGSHESSIQSLPDISRFSTPSAITSQSDLPLSPSDGPTITVTADCPSGAVDSECAAMATADRAGNYSTSLPTVLDDCTSIPEHKPITHFSVVYTSTVTFFGHRSDYTPPFEPLVTPNFCTDARDFAPALMSGPAPPVVHATAVPAAGAVPMGRKAFRPSFTFITTDKNPSVAFPSDPPPRFSMTRKQAGDDDGDVDHKPAASTGGGSVAGDAHMTAAGTSGNKFVNGRPRVDNHGGGDHKPAAGAGDGIGVGIKSAGQAMHTPDAARADRRPLPSFGITARGNQVTINDKTFPDLGPGKTSFVTANGALFTILPHAIVGEGATIQKPAPAGTVVSVATPVNSVVAGLPVTLKGSEAIVGDATLTMAVEATTAVVDGQQVTLRPGTLLVGRRSLSFEPVMPAREKEILVKGGELLTAIGPSVVVIHSTTFTYGPGFAQTTKVVDDDTITLGPSGVLVHHTLLGGPSAGVTDTSYEAVGGATITRIAPSLAVINGRTFAIGPGTKWTTTAIAGETLTIGPTGIVMSTVTLSYPFGRAVTTTVRATGTYSDDRPSATAPNRASDKGGKGGKGGKGDKGGEDEDNTGNLIGPNFSRGWIALSMAAGVVLWA